MKFKFSDEMQAVIDAIAELPDEADGASLSVLPGKLVSQYERELIRAWNGRKLAMKIWARRRRELSFLYELSMLTDKMFSFEKSGDIIQAISQGKSVVKPTDEERHAQKYKMLVKFIKDIKSGEMLKHDTMITIALNYGIIELSDEEIQTLLKLNNK